MLIGPRRRSPYRRALEAPCSPWWKCRRPRAWGLRGELKARGGGDAGTSSTTSNAEIAPQPPCAQRVPAARGHLQRWRSSTMSPHRLRRAALHLPTRRSERGLLYFHHGLLASLPVKKALVFLQESILIKVQGRRAVTDVILFPQPGDHLCYRRFIRQLSFFVQGLHHCVQSD